MWVERDGRLEITEVEIARRDKSFAYVTSGLADGDIIITSPLDTVTDKMNVRVNITGENSLETAD